LLSGGVEGGIEERDARPILSHAAAQQSGRTGRSQPSDKGFIRPPGTSPEAPEQRPPLRVAGYRYECSRSRCSNRQ
jgi:hypothetical protein